MVPDAEVIKVFTEILDELQVGKYVIKINHRRLLVSPVSICVPPCL